MVVRAYCPMSIDDARVGVVQVMVTINYPILICFSVADQYYPASLVVPGVKRSWEKNT